MSSQSRPRIVGQVTDIHQSCFGLLYGLEYILQEGAKPSKAVRYYDARSYRFLRNKLPQETVDVQREGEIGSTDTQPSGGADMQTSIVEERRSESSTSSEQK